MDDLAKKNKIRNLVEKYADAVCRKDEDNWRSCWHKDAKWNLTRPPQETGVINIVNRWKTELDKYPYYIQLINNGVCDCSTNTGRWYISEYIELDNKDILFLVGLYKDTYINIEDEIYFSQRDYSAIYRQNMGKVRIK